MNPATIQLLLQLVALASQLAPVVIQEIEGIKAQGGKTADEIFADAGVTFDANNLQALQILAELANGPANDTQS